MKKNKHMKIKWKRLWARKYSPFGMAGYALAFTSNPLFSKCPNKLVLPEGKLAACYFSEREFQRLVKHYINFLLKQKNLVVYGRKFENKFKHFYLWAKKFSEHNFSKLSNRELVEELKKLYCWYVEFGDWQYLVWPVVYGPQEKLEQYFANYPEGGKIFEAIATPYKITKIMKSRLELLKLAQLRAGKRSLLSYAKKYAWIPVYEFIDEPWGLQEFQNQLKHIKNAEAELRSFLEKRRENLRYYVNFLKQIQNFELKKLIEICHLFAYLKEMRDDYRRPAFYLLRGFWQEIAQRTSLNFEQTNFLLVGELIQILKTGKKPILAEIQSRQKQYAIILKNGKLKIYSGAHTNKILKMVAPSTATSRLKGTCASGGRVYGRVSIILHQDDFKKFKKGQILATNMTHPEFVPILKLAKAVVTDEGGITCHAAIISRELKIPCIIGTKIATKVLKDGDLVEMDADKGVVRIIKK